MRGQVEALTFRAQRAGQRAVQWLMLLRERSGLPLVALISLAASPMLLVGGLWTWHALAGKSAPAVATADGWRYLLVCGQCQHRERVRTPPQQRLAAQGGLLECPNCKAFKAAWYRRGSLTVPPGGW